MYDMKVIGYVCKIRLKNLIIFELSIRCCYLVIIMMCLLEWFFLLGLFLGWGF